MEVWLIYHELSKKNGQKHSSYKHCFSDPSKYMQKLKKSGRKQITDDKLEEIVELAKSKVMSSSQIKQQHSFNISKWSVINYLNRSGIYGNSCTNAPFLTDIQKNKRLEWSKMILKIDWDVVLFSDEKRFNLDGNNSNLNFWKDNHTKLKNSKKYGGGSVMIWQGFQDILKTLLLKFTPSWIQKNTRGCSKA
ncbi:hypothetical protein RF11_11216 [Thelohanellus kitauei]|uniref:Transposable element Tc1 transposase n=1 Tax=Thelohanellus kitauei TaxID=669202 RepID=A0A0C2MZX2_THEKT|nr:hypothetical protein RF11_11216 [Thelohanellus kitauei]